MCEGKEMDVQSTLKLLDSTSQVSKSVKLDSYVLYGKRGFKDKISIEDRFVWCDLIGSIQCKMIHLNGNNISILFFKNGKIKISGGLCNIDNKSDYINSVVQDTSIFLMEEPCKNYEICLLNAQFKIEMNNRLFRNSLFKVHESKIFYYVKDPPMTGRGNIVCGRAYPFESRKSHLSISPKGTVQMFAFKTFQEIVDSMNLLISVLT